MRPGGVLRLHEQQIILDAVITLMIGKLPSLSLAALLRENSQNVTLWSPSCQIRTHRSMKQPTVV